MGFGYIFFIYAALLVGLYISQTTYMASGSDPTLLFGRRTERRYVYICYEVMGYILYLITVVGGNTYSTGTKMGARTSLFLTSQRMPGVTTRI